MAKICSEEGGNPGTNSDILPLDDSKHLGILLSPVCAV